MTKRQAKAKKPSSLKSSGERSLQTFTEHIHELRRRLFWSVVVGLLVGSIVYNFHDFFVRLVMAPLGHQKLIYLTPVGGFSFIFMVTFQVTLILIAPFVMYQLYAFLRPAIPRHTRSLSIKVAIAAILLLATGATFGYLYAVPGGLRFLSDFAGTYVTPSLTAESYLSFVLGYVLGLGLLFELPLLLLFWHWINPTTPKGLFKTERYVIVGAFIIAAIISPSPDVLSQTIIAVPIIVVYQFGVIAVLLSIRKSRKQFGAHEKHVPHSRIVQAILNEQDDEAPRIQPVPTSPQAAEKSSRPDSGRPQRAFIDGMGAQRPLRRLPAPAQIQAPTAKPHIPQASRNDLRVPERRVMDFGPVRRPMSDQSA